MKFKIGHFLLIYTIIDNFVLKKKCEEKFHFEKNLRDQKRIYIIMQHTKDKIK